MPRTPAKTQRKLKVGDPVRLDGKDGTVGEVLKDGRGRLDVAPGQVYCTASELCWAPEGFWYLPHRVGATIPADIKDAVITHKHWVAGRDDLALNAVKGG